MNKEKIEEICELLKQAWLMLPDLRLGQLIENLAKIANPQAKDAFYVEDEDMERAIKLWLAK